MSDVPAARQALALLRILAERGPSAASALAASLPAPRSTTYHLLATLREAGFVERLAAERRWTLGPAAAELGAAYQRHDPLQVRARAPLTALAAEVGATTHLGVLHGAEILYLIKESPPRAREVPTLITAVGVRLPAATTASGRAILAHLPAEQVRAVMSAPTAFVSRTDSGPRSLGELRTVLAAERRQGFSVEIGEILDGYASIALPVLDRQGNPVASVSVTMRVADTEPRAARTRLTDLVPEIRRTAAALSP